MNEDQSKSLSESGGIAVQENDERQLQLTDDTVRAIFEEFEIAVTVTDEQGRLVSWNPFAQSLLGMSDEDLHGKPVRSLYPPQEWEKIKISEHPQKGMPQRLKTTMVRKNGKPFDSEIMLSTLKNAQGQVTGSIGVFREFTPHELLEQKLKEANRVKSEFVSVVSHELRTPLTAIKGGIDVVLDGLAGKINPEQKDVLDVAQRNLDRLQRLINDLLDLDKLESGKMRFNIEQVDINDVIRDIHQLILPSLTGSGIDFSIQLADPLPKIRADRDKMTQVITNLVGNAIKFTEKGTITITTEQRENLVQVSVSDTGCGISPEDLPRAFYKFEQLEPGGQKSPSGTGLGLSISKEIIEQHRGKIYGESEEGKGTTFYMIMPIIERRRSRRREAD